MTNEGLRRNIVAPFDDAKTAAKALVAAFCQYRDWLPEHARPKFLKDRLLTTLVAKAELAAPSGPQGLDSPELSRGGLTMQDA